MAEFQHELDSRHQNCPAPVMQTKQALKNMSSGEVLHVIATDPTSVHDIYILLEAMDDELIESNEGNGEYHFYIKKG